MSGALGDARRGALLRGTRKSDAPVLAAEPAPGRKVHRCLFVGLGGIGQRHLRNLRALRGASLAIDAYRVRRERQVVDDSLLVVPGEDLESKYDVAVHGSLAAALSQKPDVVFVTNPSSLHLDIALAALESGAHVLVEKPLSHSLAGVAELLAASAERRLVGYVAFQLRFHPGFVRTAELLAAGTLGRPLFVEAVVGEYLPGFHPYEDYRRMYASRHDLGGGVTLSQIHEIDCLLALFGLPERVFSLGGKLSSLEVDVDDVSCSLLEYRSSDGRLLPVRLHQDYVQRPAQRHLTIVGERGKLEWSLRGRSLKRYDADGELVEAQDYADLPRNQLFERELSHFLACVESGERPLVSLADGARSLAVALSLLESQQTGMPVAVSEVLERAGLSAPRAMP